MLNLQQMLVDDKFVKYFKSLLWKVYLIISLLKTIQNVHKKVQNNFNLYLCKGLKAPLHPFDSLLPSLFLSLSPYLMLDICPLIFSFLSFPFLSSQTYYHHVIFVFYQLNFVGFVSFHFFFDSKNLRYFTLIQSPSFLLYFSVVFSILYQVLSFHLFFSMLHDDFFYHSKIVHFSLLQLQTLNFLCFLLYAFFMIGID